MVKKLNWKYIFDLCSSLLVLDCFVTLSLRRVGTEKSVKQQREIIYFKQPGLHNMGAGWSWVCTQMYPHLTSEFVLWMRKDIENHRYVIWV